MKRDSKTLDLSGLGLDTERRVLEGERLVALVLRAGALLAGGLFALAVVLSGLSDHTAGMVAAAELSQRAGLTVLVATPVLRLVVSGAMLAAGGEWRYALYALAVLGLLGLSVGAGYTH